MYLKRLELHGFKSFADPTELEFTPGITAIVGPNGSGKSNVFDAIRWVLGETNARSLRSGRMEDVIFAGSEGRRAMGQAEVSLTLDNTSGGLPVEYAEVTVTRRAIRGGEGEYALNGLPCRLRDIQMLFLGTGLGGRSYSLIGQGQVDSVLSASPEERRQLLEEAAGLARHKRRRHEADRRLARAAEHLLRATDVLAELRDQLEQLCQQAEAATAYEAAAAEIRRLDLALQADEARRALAGARRIAAQVEAARAQVRALADEATSVGAQMDHLRARALEVAAAWEDGQRALLRAVEEMAGRESAIQVLTERLRATTAARARLAAELEQVLAHGGEAERETQALRETAARLARRREELLDHLREAEEAGSRARQQLLDAQARLAAARRDLHDLLAARHRTQHETARVDARLSTIAEQLRDVEESLCALEAEEARLRAAAADARADRDDAERRRAEAAQRLADARGRLRDAAQRVERASARCRQLASEAEVASRTLALLEDLESERAGGDGVVRDLLADGAGGPLEGLVADALVVPAPYRTAVEALLGRALYAIIARTAEGACAVLEAARDRGGAVAVVPADLLTAPVDPPLPSGAEVVGRAVDLVEVTDGARPVVEALLGEAAVVRDVRDALALRRAGFRGRIATLDGVLVTSEGVVAQAADPDSSALARREQIAALRRRLQDVQIEMARAEADLREAQAAAAALDAQATAAADELDRWTAAAAERALAAGVTSSALEQLAARRAELLAARDRLEAERVALEAEALRACQDEADIHQAVRERERAVEEAQAACDRVQEAYARAAEDLGETRVALAEAAGALEAVQARADEQSRTAAAARARADALAGEITVLDGELHLLTHSLQTARRDREELAASQDAARRHLADLHAERARLHEQMAAAEARWRELQETARAVEDQAHRLEVRQAQVDAELAACQRRIAEEFGVRWEDVAEMSLPGSRDEVRRRIDDLRAQMAALGPVNLRAVDEHAALAARVQGLEAQVADVERARAALAQLAGRVDRILAEQFAQTFRDVNDEFGRLCARLFGGGRAHLHLVEGEPGTDPGVEIEVQLPGKALRSLPALSGGERVLVALALIFAMLRVHPSPFCIFDEVEASLDDANTRRFTLLLRELAERTQVVIITHNKATMEAADVLYGVTMETPGVSTVISMRLRRPAPAPEAAAAPA
ncbi:MAG: chromosome segregation protein SMC [Armatimonadota bacterium]|nr:chromosome segregation protein SMC [Armatimonadota bacterium]MDR7436757.1 chromosome segregation protein SMC [Armatimonadota bacterium]MDR7472704.1 chromosome segregation protein SMC [Armatimonadota bacterium]MDR7507005.1 chromosome segregation protein SMC [Armatimonadota bacterium]MDR7508866.1 chromosome segregation protein SMC [Armatimonadota bacterium]